MLCANFLRYTQSRTKHEKYRAHPCAPGGYKLLKSVEKLAKYRHVLLFMSKECKFLNIFASWEA